jgi:glyoxylase-like metal-dependent hydrolase (beta-lactamase superfamily II)
MSQPAVHLRQLELGPMQNFIYLIGDAERREAAVVDPGWEVPQILRVAAEEGYRLTAAFVTHHHFDHVMGLEELLRQVDCPVYVHREDASHLARVRSALRPTSDGDTVEVGRLPVHLIHTPGHTPGSQCLLIGPHLLSGDTLFIGACGRWDLPGGDPAALYESLTTKLKPLDDDTILWPGHHYAAAASTRLGEEKQANPFLNVPSVEAFLHRIGG